MASKGARRDSLFGERILWRGKPTRAALPLLYRVIATAAAVFAVSTLLFAVVNSLALHRPVGGMLLFAAWCATLGLGAWRLPLVWADRLEYLVTDQHVIVKRGPLRRTIDRAQISYAIIRWSKVGDDVGDLVLERAVPTGALKRTLRLELSGVEAPDRVLDLIRGVRDAVLDEGTPAGRAAAPPLPQRLEEGERVLWSAMPLASSPWTRKRMLGAFVGASLLVVVGKSLVRFVPAMTTLARAHVLSAFLFALLVGATVLVLVGLVALAVSALYSSWVRPVLLARQTRYFVTDRRVLIRRGNEELHLDRKRIAYVIAAKSSGSASDLFLVLDGPQARAMSVSGAFGGAANDDDSLQPVFNAVGDSETAFEILAIPSPRVGPIRDAA